MNDPDPSSSKRLPSDGPGATTGLTVVLVVPCCAHNLIPWPLAAGAKSWTYESRRCQPPARSTQLAEPGRSLSDQHRGRSSDAGFEQPQAACQCRACLPTPAAASVRLPLSCSARRNQKRCGCPRATSKRLVFCETLTHGAPLGMTVGCHRQVKPGNSEADDDLAGDQSEQSAVGEGGFHPYRGDDARERRGARHRKLGSQAG
jgi:hypothetical protein